MKIIKPQFFSVLVFISLFLSFAGAKANEPDTDLTKPKVIFETSMGSYILELYPDKAPKTVANFLQYVDEGFYSNTLFHRVIPRFVVQAGGFSTGMQKKSTHAPVVNESDNGLKNTRGTISMARTRDPDSATSQFFINVDHNVSLDNKSGKPGYAVFGKVIEGMEIVDKIINSPTTTVGRFQNVPEQDILILSVTRKGGLPTSADKNNKATQSKSTQAQQLFVAGEHYSVLDRPVPTRDNSKIEVVEIFSYGCPHCYEMEPLIKKWSQKQSDDIDFWAFPTVWSQSTGLYARAFYASQQLQALEQTHLPLFSEIVAKQKQVRNENDIANIYQSVGVDKQATMEAFKSAKVINSANQAEQRVRMYRPAGVPEIIINGKYRIDRMRAGGLKEMLAVADFLINKERELLKK